MPQPDRIPRLAAFTAALLAGGLVCGWFKLLDVWGGRTLLTQGVALAVIFGGLLLAFLLSHLLRRLKPGLWLCALLLTLSGAWTAALLTLAPDMHHNWLMAAVGLNRTYETYLRLLWATAVALMLPVCLLHGLCAAFLARKHPVSTIRIFSVMGFCIGALLFPRLFGAIPFERLMAGLAFLTFLSAAGLAAALTRPAAFKPLWLLPLGAAVCFIPWRAPDPPCLAKGVMGMVANRDFAFSGKAPIAAYRESWAEVRTIFADDDYGHVYTVEGRPVMADTRFRTAQTAAAALPFILKPHGASFALSGPESWIYALPMRRIAAGIPEATLYIENRDLPAKKQGENRVETPALEPKPHDALLIAPPPNWLRGAHAYTTAAYYKACARFLAPDGLLLVHLDTRGMNAEMIGRRLLALKQTYSTVQIWVTGINDWILAASRAPIAPPLSAMLERGDSPAVFKELLAGGIRSIPQLLAANLCSGADVDRLLAAGNPAVTHKAPYTESHTAQRLLFEAGQGMRLFVPFEPFHTQSLSWIPPGDLEPAVAEGIIKETERLIGARGWANLAVQLLNQKNTQEALELASRIRAANPNDMLMMEWADRIELDARHLFELAEYKRALAAYETILAISQGTPGQNFGAARAAQALGEKTKALAYFRAATDLAPDSDPYIFALAQAEVDCETYADAALHYDFLIQHARAQTDRHRAAFLKAQLLVKKENPHRDPQTAADTALALCDETQWENPAYTYGLADILIEAGRVMEGVSLKRKLREEQGAGSARLPESTLRPRD